MPPGLVPDFTPVGEGEEKKPETLRVGMKDSEHGCLGRKREGGEKS